MEVKREINQVLVVTNNRSEKFDKVIFATHSDQTLNILKDISSAEKDVLEKIRYQPNKAYLHTDSSLLPKSEKLWSAWNYISKTDKLNKRAVAVSYLINKLQPLPFKTPVIVTLNPPHSPDPKKVLRIFEYDHPVFDQPAINSQTLVHSIQGKNNTYFAGAWCGYGFHEDGLKSGIEVANLLGAKLPW
jgi:predicted NAD/FAD-binding protein